MIVGDNQMWVRNLFVDRFCLGPLTVQGANGQEDLYEQNNREPLTKVKQLIRAWSDRDKVSDSSESGRIATDLTKEQLTKHKNKYEQRQRFGVGQRSGSGTRGLKPARSQKLIAEVLKIQEVQEVDIGR